jgi:hypothetical protein
MNVICECLASAAVELVNSCAFRIKSLLQHEYSPFSIFIHCLCAVKQKNEHNRAAI